MAPTLHHVPKTISSPIVQVLHELGLVPDHINVNTLTFDDLKKDSHLAVNPMGTSPAFQDGDIIIWESGAVLTYILERFDLEHKLHPAPGYPSFRDRAKFLQLQQYIIATVYPFVASLFIHTLKPKGQQDEAYVLAAKQKWFSVMAPVLTKELSDGPYFMGNSLSVIDFLVCKPLSNLKAMRILEKTPQLAKLFEEIRARPSFEKSYAPPTTTTTAAETQTNTPNKGGQIRRSLMLVLHVD